MTPLQGVFLGGDLKTFQSNLSGQLRFLPARDFVSLLYHVRESQKIHRNDLIRAAETMAESRLGVQNRSLQELERLTIGTNEAFYEQFLEELTGNFRHILYGREEDVIGIHIISYFIGRSIPQLRDRPTSRKTFGTGAERGQRILANIAEIIPLAKQGSLLRAISHNQAQTAVLGHQPTNHWSLPRPGAFCATCFCGGRARTDDRGTTVTVSTRLRDSKHFANLPRLEGGISRAYRNRIPGRQFRLCGIARR